MSLSVFVSSAQDLVEKMMKSIAGESKGLFILNSNAMALPGFGTELLECVVSHQNPFLGKRVSEIAPLFAERYNRRPHHRARQGLGLARQGQG